MALSNIQKIIQREENDEICALYGAGNCCLSPEYQQFQVASHVWHSWSEERKADHLRKFREYVPNISNTFCMPTNAGRKPSYQHRDRNTTEPDIEKSISGNIISIVQHLQFHSVIPRHRLKRVWITSSHKFTKVSLKMPGKLRLTKKSWESYGCVIVSKNYLDRQVNRKRKGKMWPDVHTLPWELSQELQWDILCPHPFIWLTQRHTKSLQKQTKPCCLHLE